MVVNLKFMILPFDSRRLERSFGVAVNSEKSEAEVSVPRLEVAEGAVCGGVALRGLCPERFEPGTKEADERVGGGRAGRGLALHPGLQPGSGDLFGSVIKRRRIPEGSKPGEHRVEAGAHGGAAVIGATNKMVFVREVQIPEHAVEEFSAIVS